MIGAGAFGTYFFYSKYQKAQFQLDNPDAVAKTEIKALTDKVGKLMQLPTDEDPNVATVLDQDKLKDQPFFANAQNGDKIMIYSVKKIAILYRESENKIIGVSPLAEPTPEPSVAPSKTPKATSVEE